MIPPPPIPWIDLPVSRSAKSFERAAIMTPTKNKVVETMMTGILPKMWLKDAKVGCSTVDASRNEVPAQKASMADPCSFLAMMGRATLIDVPSRATMSVKTDRAANARTSRIVGLNSGASADGRSSCGFSEDIDADDDVFWDVDVSGTGDVAVGCSAGANTPLLGSEAMASGMEESRHTDTDTNTIGRLRWY